MEKLGRVVVFGFTEGRMASKVRTTSEQPPQSRADVEVLVERYVVLAPDGSIRVGKTGLRVVHGVCA